jgi:LacI family transcriptional regulator
MVYSEKGTGNDSGIVTRQSINEARQAQAMRRSKKTVTIHDVARASGVSVSTVFRVLNDKDGVAIETYESVQDVIAELGHTFSLAAKSMRSRRTRVIGIVLPDVDNPFTIQIIRGVNRAITELDYDLIAYTRRTMPASSRQCST